MIDPTAERQRLDALLSKMNHQKPLVTSRGLCARCSAPLGMISWAAGNSEVCVPCWSGFERSHGHSPDGAWRAEDDALVCRLSDEHFERFCDDAALFVQSIEQEHGSRVACNVLTNLLIGAAAWQMANAMQFLVGLPVSERQKYATAKHEAIMRVFLEPYDDGKGEKVGT